MRVSLPQAPLRLALGMAALAVTLASCAPATIAAGTGSVGRIVPLDRISTLRSLFNRDAGRTRLILIFSPT